MPNISYALHQKFIWTSYGLPKEFMWIFLALYGNMHKFRCNSHEVHMTGDPELPNAISYEFYLSLIKGNKWVNQVQGITYECY